MTLTQNVDLDVYKHITQENIDAVARYIDEPMTATTFSRDNSNPGNSATVTAEIIYYWMITFNIPSEYQKWHLNRLLTLIKVCNIKNQPPKKMSSSEILSGNRALNEARRRALGTKG